MRKTVFNLIIAGVGGQGSLTLSRIMADAAIHSGYSVRTGETLGMAQRGGSVLSFVRIGKAVRSPLFALRTADALLGLEALEAVRASAYIKVGGLILVDPIMKDTLTTLMNRDIYPPLKGLMERLDTTGSFVHLIPASAESSRLGNPKSANVLMLGAFCSYVDIFPVSIVEESIVRVLGSRGAPAIKVFRKGMEIAQKNSDRPRQVAR
jgi:indolepyruvate ferredoxin oxidoreductase beta subunit